MNIVHIRNFFVLLFTVGFFFYPNFQTVSGLLAFLLTCFIKPEAAKLKQTIKHPITIVMAIFFVLHVLGLSYTENMNNGLQSVQNKLPFLLFPVFFLVIFSSINLKKVIQTLLVSGGVYAILCFVRAFYFYFTQQTTAYFFSSDLNFELVPGQIILHPTYGAVYFTIILTLISYFLITKTSVFQKINAFILIVIGLCSLAYIVFAGSKLGFLTFIINAIFILVFYAVYTKQLLKTGLAALVLLVVGFVSIYNSPLKLKFEQAYHEMFHGNQNPDDYYMSTGARLWAWNTTIEIIEKNPVLGVGTGDIKDELNSIYDEKNMVYVKGLDPHQQYLQTFATIGLGGLLSLILMLGSLLYYAIKNKNFLLLVFAFTYVFWGFTESMLERHQGVLFFITIAVLLLQLPKQINLKSVHE